MKNYLIVGLIGLVAALTIGVEPVQRFMNEAVNRGTVRGVENCMSYAKSELLSQDAVKASCVEAFHERLDLPDLASGEAGPRLDQGKMTWEGVLQNKTADYVITWILISVIVSDAEGKKQEVLAETSIWIDPMGKADFQVELPNLKPEQFHAIDFCDPDVQTPKACMVWELVHVKGVSI